MKMRCESVIWSVLPGLRRELTRALHDLGLSQKEISECLGITQAAVSQYLKNKRGTSIEFEEDIKKEIVELAERIARGEVSSLDEEICRLCRMIRER